MCAKRSSPVEGLLALAAGEELDVARGEIAIEGCPFLFTVATFELNDAHDVDVILRL